MWISWLLVGCTPESVVDEPLVDLGPELDQLFIPDISDIDIEQAFVDALVLATKVNMVDAWRGHKAALDLMQPGCPDLYVGAPDRDDMDLDDDAGGLSWSDFCITPGGLYFNGFTWWENGLSVDTAGAGGDTTDAFRRIVADGTVGTDDNVSFEFDGEGADALSLVVDGDYERWTYSSLVEATVTGRAAFDDSTTPGGYRTDLNLFLTGGDVDSIVAEGNVYLFDTLLHGRFDSLLVDLEFVGTNGAGPDACTLEPLGYIGLRDPNAYWYDVVFLPRESEDITGSPYPNDPLQVCDGKGTLYIRGQEQGEVAPDFSGIFEQISKPEPTDYVLSLRDVAEDQSP